MKREFVVAISAVILGVLIVYLPLQILNVPQQPSYVTMEGRNLKTAPENHSEIGESVVIDSIVKACLVLSLGLLVAFGVMLYTKRKVHISS